jgi:hypothetical protein
MKLSRLAPLACTTLPLLLALSLPADDLSFHPAANSEVSKTLKVDMEMNVKELSFTIDGNPMPGDPLGQVTENALLVNMLVGVTDKFVESKDGKPVVLHRTFDKLKLDTEFGDDSTEVDSFKEPEGKTVEFKWDEKEGAYTKSFHESDGDAAELKDLDVDMDLRALLPDKKVSKGDTWDVPAAKLKSVFLPGGMITKSSGQEDEAAVEKIRASLEEQFLAALKDFKITCTYKGAKDDEGTNVGEIAFAYDGKMKLDLGSLIEEAIEANRQEGMPEMDIKANLGVGLKGDGTLLWNQAAGHMHNFEMHAQADMDIDMAVHMQMGDTTQNMALTGQAASKINWALAPTKK